VKYSLLIVGFLVFSSLTAMAKSKKIVISGDAKLDYSNVYVKTLTKENGEGEPEQTEIGENFRLETIGGPEQKVYFNFVSDVCGDECSSEDLVKHFSVNINYSDKIKKIILYRNDTNTASDPVVTELTYNHK
jgi:hypothetical protein